MQQTTKTETLCEFFVASVPFFILLYQLFTFDYILFINSLFFYGVNSFLYLSVRENPFSYVNIIPYRKNTSRTMISAALIYVTLVGCLYLKLKTREYKIIYGLSMIINTMFMLNTSIPYTTNPLLVAIYFMVVLLSFAYSPFFEGASSLCITVMIVSEALFVIMSNMKFCFAVSEVVLIANYASFILLKLFLVKEDSQSFLFVVSFVVGILIICTLSFMLVYVLYGKWRSIFWNKHSSMCFYAFLFYIYISLAYFISYFVLHDHLLVWAYRWLTKSLLRVSLVMFWFIVLFLAAVRLPVVDQTHYPLTIKRKFFHLLCVVIFLPVIYLDNELIYNAFGIALCLFFIIELLRVIEIPPFGVVTKFFQIFIDSRDNGVFVLTHISLLLGCAITDWLVDGLEGKQNYIEIVRMLGTIVLGLGDTNASLFGVALGRHRIMNTNKTLEGLMGFIITVFIALILVHFLIYHELSPHIEHIYFVMSLLTGLCELYTKDVDNYILPTYILALALLLL